MVSSTVPDGNHVPDAELLRRFVSERDAAAFELLVCRHADAVWTACRGVLRRETDAEDAFQATFLVLAHKAATVRNPSVGGWLHRVAVNAALKLRERSTRAATATAEQLDALQTPIQDAPNSDLSAHVHEELANLPERYRLPVVLCELEGYTHAEAARVLGWPVGSVSSRLSRARTLLRNRLVRRGSYSPVVMFPAVCLPPNIVRITTAVVDGTAPVLPSVSILTEGVIAMMHFAQRKLFAMGLLSVTLVALAAFGTYTVLGQPPARPAIEPATAQVPTNQKDQSSILRPRDSIAGYPNFDPKRLEEPRPEPIKIPKELLDNRLDSARKVYEQNLTRLKGGQGIPTELFGWSERWLEAELALTEKEADRVKALRNHLDRTREVERVVISFAKAVQGRQADADAATYYRLEAEIRLRKEGIEHQPAKDEKGKP